MENSSKKKKKVKDIFLKDELEEHSEVSPVGESMDQMEEEEATEQKYSSEKEIPVSLINRFRFSHEPETEEGPVEAAESLESLTVISGAWKPRRQTRMEGNFSGKKKLIIFGSIAAVLILAYVGLAVLPRAEIKITADKTEMPYNNTILVDTNTQDANFGQAVIPGSAFVFEASETQEFSSTGQGKDQKKAKGTITIYNNYSTAPQILVATTRFEAPDGKIFRLDSRIVIPGATTKNGELVPSTIDVKVTADQAGPDYNIEACNLPDCKFTIPGFAGTDKFEGFYGISAQVMEGGALASVPLVTSEDLKKAEKTVLDKVMNTLQQDVENKIPTKPQKLTVLSGGKSGVSLTDLDSDAEIGDSQETFSVSAQGEIKVIAFDENDVIQLIQYVLAAGKNENYEYCQNPALEYAETRADFNAGTLQITVNAKQTACHKLSSEEIQEAALGKNAEELSDLFESTDGIASAEVNFWPFWVGKTPRSLEKISIIID